MDTKIWIDTSDVENVLHGVHELAEGMGLDIYGRTAEGIMRTDEGFSADDIVTRAITDGNLHVTAKEDEGKEARA